MLLRASILYIIIFMRLFSQLRVPCLKYKKITFVAYSTVTGVTWRTTCKLTGISARVRSVSSSGSWRRRCEQCIRRASSIEISSRRTYSLHTMLCRPARHILMKLLSKSVSFIVKVKLYIHFCFYRQKYYSFFLPILPIYP